MKSVFRLANFKGPGHCAACQHPRRPIIDAHLVNETESMRTLGERYGMTATSLYRHRVNHLGIANARTGRLPKNPERGYKHGI